MFNLSRRIFLEKTAGTAGMAALAAVALTQSQERASIALPISGLYQSELASFDELMADFVQAQRVPGAAWAVTRGSRLVYARGFGLADRERNQAVQPADLFRIASISKPITAVAILQLVERAKLGLSAKVWEVLNLPEPSDDRWKYVTIWQLLHHTGGWDDKIFDPMFQSARIAKALNVSTPANQEHIISYMLRQPLQFDPGDHFAYTNFGYCLLGRVIERVSGVDYEHYVQLEVLAPLGIHRMRLGRTLPSLRAPTEVTYYEEKNRTAAAVIGIIGQRVPLPYGAWSLEAMDSHGGWLASAIDLARFACAFDDPATCPILQPKTIELMFARPEGKAGIEVDGNYPGCAWFVWPDNRHAHNAYTSSNGSLAGTSSYLMRRRDGMNWAVLFNAGNGLDGKPLMVQFRDLSNRAFERTARWPGTDQFSTLL
jgi:CubicO group peptidase (beta-lactamase class C family)